MTSCSDSATPELMLQQFLHSREKLKKVLGIKAGDVFRPINGLPDHLEIIVNKHFQKGRLIESQPAHHDSSEEEVELPIQDIHPAKKLKIADQKLDNLLELHDTKLGGEEYLYNLGNISFNRHNINRL